MSRNERSALQSYMCTYKNSPSKIICKGLDFPSNFLYYLSSSLKIEIELSLCGRDNSPKELFPALAGREATASELCKAKRACVHLSTLSDADVPVFFLQIQKLKEVMMQKKTNVCVSIDKEQMQRIDDEQLTRELGRWATFRLMIYEFFQRREENGERKTNGKHKEHEHR